MTAVHSPSTEDLLIDNEQHELLHRMLEQLPPREKLVLENRFGFDGEAKTLREVAAMLGGVCKERVRQIEAKAIRRFRHPSYRLLLRERSFHPGPRHYKADWQEPLEPLKTALARSFE